MSDQFTSQKSSSSVPWKTAAYLEELPQQQHDAPKVASAAASLLAVMTHTARVCSSLLAGVIVLMIVMNAMSMYGKERDRRTCGVDSLLRASGSNKTFESILKEKLEEARRDFDREWADSQSTVKPFEFKEFDADSLNWNPSPIHQPQFRGNQ